MAVFSYVKNSSLIASVVLLASCGGNDFRDLDAFMATSKAKPAGQIEPIPPFKAYKAFTYGAAGLRSPFEKPVEVKEIARMQLASNVEPDLDRTKEFLEQFSLDSLTMVGSLEQAGTLWVLMQDREGGVHRVKEGNYVGRNHGRILEAAESYIALIEIVASGTDGWVERPRTIKLRVVEE